MKKELYENFLLVKYLHITIAQINMLETHEREYYLNSIHTYLENEN